MPFSASEFFGKLFRAGHADEKSATARNAERSAELRRLCDFLGIDDAAIPNGELGSATYYACLKVLSECVGKLPFRIQRMTESAGVEIMRGHPYYRMINERPNPYMSATTFWSLMEFWRNHYGNAYAWIDTRDPARPALWPMNPSEVDVWYDDAKAIYEQPDVYYRYSPAGKFALLGSEEVLHFKSHNVGRGGLVGIPMRDQLLRTILGDEKAQDMLNKMTDSGMTAKAVLQYTGSLSDKNVQELVSQVDTFARGELKDPVTGKRKKLSNVIPIPVGFTLQPLNVKLADSQFLELRQFSATQIAAAFGVKPTQIGDYSKSSYSTAEAQQLSFLVDTMLYIVKGYEEEIGYKLISDREAANGYHVKLDTGVLLRADQETKIRTLSTAVSNFLLTPNEARRELNLPSKTGGDRLLGNGNAIPVEFAGQQYTTERSSEDA